jgi:hypothetical protein
MKFIATSLAQLAVLAALASGAAGCASAASGPAACDNADFTAVQQAHRDRTEVAFCGIVVRVGPARETRSGRHRAIYVDAGHGNVIEIDADLDQMGNFPVTDGEHAAVRGEYYYDSDGREGVHWTHHTDRGPHPPGYLTLDGTTYS